MKTLLISIMFFSFLFLSSQYAQDIKAKLAGNKAKNGFTVVDDNDKVLFKVTGEGNLGINTDTPTALLDVQGGSSSLAAGRSVNIVAETGVTNGGNIFLKAGNADEGYGSRGGAKIVVGGGTNSSANGGDINILSGTGADYGGDINIISGWAEYLTIGNAPSDIQTAFAPGDINIHTGTTNHYGGKIRIYTEQDNGGGGDIEISTGNSEGDGNKITLRTGVSDGNGSDIILEAGSGGNGGEDIFLIPNSNGGFVRVNGSGTYPGSWGSLSDERYKKNIEPIENSLDEIKQLIPVSYEWKKEEYQEKNFQEGKQIGLIAQDVEKVLPILVSTDSDGYKSIDYTKINVLLIEAIKVQQKSIEDLRTEMNELRSNLRNDISLNTRVNN